MSSEWEQFQEQERQRRQREDAAQKARERDRLISEQQVPAQLAKKKQLEAEKGRQSCQELAKEAREVYHLDAIAQSIKEDWERFGVPVQIDTTTHPEVMIEDDGRVFNYSKAGFKISYSYPDIETKEDSYYPDTGGDIVYTTTYTPVTTKPELYFGLGNFMPTLSYIDTKHWTRRPSFKAFYVIVNSPPPSQVLSDAINIADTGSQQSFYRSLFETVEYFKPEHQIPAARERVRQYNERQRSQVQPPQQKPGWLRRMFKRG